MSHDFAFWDSDSPLENEEAGEIYQSLVTAGASDRVKPSRKIALLAKRVRSEWPTPRRGREDEWPLASPPDVSPAHMIVCMVPSRLWDVWPILGDFATELELIMYDPQQEHVFLPPRHFRKRTRMRAKAKRQRNK